VLAIMQLRSSEGGRPWAIHPDWMLTSADRGRAMGSSLFSSPIILTALATTALALSTFQAHGQGVGPAKSDPATIEKITLADGIYLFRAPPELDLWTSSNSLVVVNDSDVVVFDSNARPSTSRLVISEIRKITNKPVRILINSHWHMDHWMGNAAYADAFPGLQIIATTETRGYMARLPVQFFVNSAGAVRARAALDTAVAMGKLADGSPLTPDRRQQLERRLAVSTTLANELTGTRQVLPTVTFNDSMRFRSGRREFRLFSATGDASGSAVLYLPADRILVTGDVLVRQEDGDGAQPWTTNSYRISPWLASLRAMEAMDVGIIVPGQGPALNDKTYLRMTISLYESIIRQVHTALERGAVRLDQVQAAVKLDEIRQQFTKGNPTLTTRFDALVAALIRKVAQEARDGVALP
jgi:glyoxylase-like metal-dependent hydrolase (beta-lactamase superfamily II)